jgi:hypothetical protein
VAEERSAGADSDPFDSIYAYWAGEAIRKRLDPPSREKWDAIVLRLILSEDPDRVRRYRRLDAKGDETLGSDAYQMWSGLPDYAPGRIVRKADWPDFEAYEREHRGSMRQLMESQGLLDRYNALVQAQRESTAKARRAQANVLIIGCAGMAAIAFMVLTVLLIAALRLMG